MDACGDIARAGMLEYVVDVVEPEIDRGERVWWSFA